MASRWILWMRGLHRAGIVLYTSNTVVCRADRCAATKSSQKLRDMKRSYAYLAALISMAGDASRTGVDAWAATTTMSPSAWRGTSHQQIMQPRSFSVRTPYARRVRKKLSANNSSRSNEHGDMMSGRPLTSPGAHHHRQEFKVGDRIMVEVVSFGPLGASVDVIGAGHSQDDMISENETPLAQGLVLQREIRYFREGRNNVDVVRGEILEAYIERVREDGKLDIALRAVGGKAKAESVGKMILDRLEWERTGKLLLGDKSSPEDISREFPGVSKGAFKKAVSALYKKGLVQPGPESITLINKRIKE